MEKVAVPIAYNRAGQRIGGLNKNDEPVGFSGQFSPYMKNFVVESSFIRKRLGYSELGSNLPLTGSGSGLCRYIDAKGVVHLLALTTTNAYEYNPNTDNWDDISPETNRPLTTPDEFTITTPDGTEIISSEQATGTNFSGGADDRFRFAVATDVNMFTNNGGSALIMSNGVNDLYYFEGQPGDRIKTLVHTFANFASCLDIIEFWNHFFFLNYNTGSDNVRSIAYTGLGNIDDLTGPTAGVTTLTDSVGSILRAIRLGTDVVIYSTESISLCRYIGGSTLFTIPTVFYQAGLMEAGAVWPLTDYHVFVGSDQRIHKYSGSGRSEDVGHRIDCAFFNEMDYSYKRRLVTGYDPTKKKLYFFIPTPSAATPKASYVLSPDMYGGPWEYHEFADSVCSFAVLESRTDTYCDDTPWGDRYTDEVFIYCDDLTGQASAPVCVFLSSEGYVYKLDEATGKDGDADIECEYQTEDVTPDEEESFLRWSWVSFVARSNSGCSVYVSYSTDDGSTWTSVADSPVSVDGNWNTYRVPIDVASRKIRIKLYEKSSSDFSLRESIKLGLAVQTERD